MGHADEREGERDENFEIELKFNLHEIFCVYLSPTCVPAAFKRASSAILANECIGIRPNVGNFVAASHLTLNSDTRRLESRDVALERDYSFDSLFPINF